MDWREAKVPRTLNGFRDASNDPKQIKEWWSKWPDAFIGLPTGSINNLTIIDIDSDEDKEFIGLVMDYAKQAECPMVKTSKGHHVYFEYSPLIPTRTKIRLGVDTRSAGGYVIAPPSSHSFLGNSYEWLQGDFENVRPIPDHILKMLVPERPIFTSAPFDSNSKDMSKVKTALSTISADNRDDWIHVGMALKNDFGDEAFSAWERWSKTSEKYDASKMQYTWNSFGKNSRARKLTSGTIFYLAKKYQAESVQSVSHATLDEWPDPLPLKSELLPVKNLTPEMLPEPIRDWVIDIAERMNCPIDYTAVDAIVGLGGFIGSRCRVQPKQKDTGWTEVPNLWGAVVAEPGMKKTPALTASLEFVNDIERKNQEQNKEAKFQFEAELEQYRARLEQAKKANKDKAATVAKPQPPLMKRNVINNSTVEKLGAIAADNPQGLLVLTDELSGLLNMLDDHKNYQARGVYLEAWNGKNPYTFDRIDRGTVYIPCLCLSLLGNIQPDKLHQYIGKIRSEQNNDGMIQRFQMLVYPDVPEFKGIVDRAPNQNAGEQAKRLYHALIKTDFSALGARLENEKPVFKFSSDAQLKVMEWLNQLEFKLMNRENEPFIIQHLSKYRSLMPSLALIFHLINIISREETGDISMEATEQAIAWCEYLEGHARRIYAGSMATNRGVVRLAEMVINNQLQDNFTVRDVYRKEASGLKTSTSAYVACRELEVQGWIKKLDGKGGYQINPKLHTAQTLH